MEHEQLDGDIGDPIIWADLFATEFDPEDRWLIPGLVARGRNHIMIASAGAGKSEFLLWVLTRAVMGRGMNGEQIPPVKVLYLDWEMGADDLQDRMQSFGYGSPDVDQLQDLLYFQPPRLAGLDVPPHGDGPWAGGQLAQHAADHQVDVVVFDTYSRTCAGDENSNDTHIAWYTNTGAILKELGIATMRLDHEGHSKEAKGRARGGSAKIADVDVAVHLESNKQIDRTRVSTTKARMSWYPQEREFRRNTDGGIVSYDPWVNPGPKASKDKPATEPVEIPEVELGSLPEAGARVGDPVVLGLVLDHLQVDPRATYRVQYGVLAESEWDWTSQDLLRAAIKARKERLL